MSGIVHIITVIIQVGNRRSVRENHPAGIQPAVTQSEFIFLINIPVDTCQDFIRTGIDILQTITAAVITAGQFRYFINNLFHFTGTQLGSILPDIIGRRIGFFHPFIICKKEQFVFDDRSAQCQPVSTAALIIQLSSVGHILSRSFPVEVFIIIIPVTRTVESVGSRFGDRIDPASRKTALTDVKRSDNHLQFFNGFQRNRIGTRLVTVGPAGRESEYIIVHGSVDLE